MTLGNEWQAPLVQAFSFLFCFSQKNNTSFFVLKYVNVTNFYMINKNYNFYVSPNLTYYELQNHLNLKQETSGNMHEILLS